MLKNLLIGTLVVGAAMGLTSCALFKKHEVVEISPYYAILKNHALTQVYKGEEATENEIQQATNNFLIVAATLKGEPIRYGRGKIFVTISHSEMVKRLSLLQTELYEMIVLVGGKENFNHLFPKNLSEISIARALGDYRLKYYTGKVTVNAGARKALLSSKIFIDKKCFKK